MQITSDTQALPSGPLAAVLSYDLLSRKQNRARLEKLFRKSEGFDVAVLDEAHYLKNPEANRTKAVYGNSLDLRTGVLAAALKPGAAIWAASATPTKANIADLYSHLKALFPQTLNGIFGRICSYNEFVERFCQFYDGDYGRVVVGVNHSTISALVEHIRPHFIVRRKSDVAQELGAIQHIELPLNIPRRAQEVDSQETRKETEEYISALEAGADISAIEPPPHLMRQWAELGRAKVTPAATWINDFLAANPDRKLVVFARHRDVIAALRQAFPNVSVGLSGGTPQAERVRAVQLFQNDPSVRLFVGQTLAAGTSITLTAASYVLVLEPEFAAMDMYQAISRCHRLGQTETVTAYYAYANDPVDERIARAVKKRTEDFELLIGGLAASEGTGK